MITQFWIINNPTFLNEPKFDGYPRDFFKRGNWKFPINMQVSSWELSSLRHVTNDTVG